MFRAAVKNHLTKIPKNLQQIQKCYNTNQMEQFKHQLKSVLAASQIDSDPLRRLAYGSDASFYRLTPQIVVHLHSESDVTKILPIASEFKIPVTFRAAGTSLSGQALTDSVLLKLQPEHWKKATINFPSSSSHSMSISMQPGLTGGEVNRMLLPHAQKIGPDPSSVNYCMIGGIASNNASGMCCGIQHNTYNTLTDLQLVLADGSVIHSGTTHQELSQSHPRLFEGIVQIRDRILGDRELVDQIKRKFKIKCKLYMKFG